MHLPKPMFVARLSYRGPLGGDVHTAFNQLLNSNALAGGQFMCNREHIQPGFADLVRCLRDGVSQQFDFWGPSERSAGGDNAAVFSPFAGSDSRVRALGMGSISVTSDAVSDCCVRAIATGDSFVESMAAAASLVDRVDVVSAYGLQAEVEGARLIRAPVVTCLKGNWGNDGRLSEFLNFLFSVCSLSAHCIPFARNHGSLDEGTGDIVATRNVAAGDSLKYLLFNTLCSERPVSMLLENSNVSERGALWRALRNSLY